MSNDERDFLDKLRSTSINAAAELIESLQRIRSFHDELLDDAEIPRRTYADHFYQLAKLELEHADKVLRLGGKQAELVFEHVRQMARSVRGKTAPVRVVELTQAAADVYEGSFDIRNPFEQRADVRFEVSELCDAGGEPQRIEVRVACDAPEAYAAIPVRLRVEGPIASVLFGEISVYLSTDVEKRVAHRSLKVRPRE
jgi:hypothetical protein